MRTPTFSLLCLNCLLFACSVSDDGVPPSGSTSELLPFQSYTSAPQPRGGECNDAIDPGAPIVSNGFGFDLENTRAQASIIDSGNVADLALNFSYASDAVTDMKGAPAVTAQAIFFTAGDKLVALNRLSGCRYWTYTTADPSTAFRSTSVIFVANAETESGVIYTGDFAGYVRAVDARSGELLWQEFAGSAAGLHFITGGMQYHDGTLFVPVSSNEVVTGAFASGPCCTTHGMLVAFNGGTGERQWEYHTTAEATDIIVPNQRVGPNGAAIWSTPTIDVARNTVYVTTGQNYTEPTTGTSDAVIALDMDSGSVKWVYQVTAGDAWNYACEFMNVLRCPDPEGRDFDIGAPAVLMAETGNLFVGDKGGLVLSLDADDGSLNWARQLSLGSKLGGIHWAMAVDRANIYAAATDFEIDPASGARQDLIAGARPGVFALDQATGELLWEVHPDFSYEGLETPYLYSAALTVTNDVLFAASLQGTVQAFAVDDGRELWSFDSAVDITDINGDPGSGGTLDAAGVVVSGDGILVTSGYSKLFGGVGRYQAGAGNTLFTLTLPSTP